MTQKEQKRIEKTEKIIQNLEKDGYTKTEKTVTMLTANTISLLLCAPFIALSLFLFYTKNGNTWFDLTMIELVLAIALVFIAIIVHELIHGLFMGIFAGWKWDDVEFGISLKTLTPYCTCQAPLSIGQYIVTLLMPTVILGFIPAVIAAFTGSSLLFEFSLFLILGGGGDFLITFLLLTMKKQGKEIFIIDHPNKCGFYSFSK